MAKVKLGALAQDVRGSIAGQTFSRNKGGSYVRQKVSPTQPLTPRQSAQRAVLSTVSRAWALLSTEARAAWAAWAEANPVLNVFGDAIKLNGAAAFQRLNAILVTNGNVPREHPPTGPISASCGFTGADVTETGITLNHSNELVPYNVVQIWAWVTQAQQTTTPHAQLRLIYTAGVTEAKTLPPINLPGLNPLVDPVAGQRFHFVIAEHDLHGRLIATTIGSVIVVHQP